MDYVNVNLEYNEAHSIMELLKLNIAFARKDIEMLDHTLKVDYKKASDLKEKIKNGKKGFFFNNEELLERLKPKIRRTENERDSQKRDLRNSQKILLKYIDSLFQNDMLSSLTFDSYRYFLEDYHGFINKEYKLKSI